jgi:hypothetical protein
VGWPQTSEIDIMEFVGREPNEVFGTLHGPGYSGGQSYGRSYDVGEPVGDVYHVFAVEWQPDTITWTIDGFPYFTANADDPFLQGKQWVFNHPFFILLNVAVGGNFGGAVGPDTTFPQTMSVDYVRLYQTQPAPVSYSTSLHDDFTGWRRISIPFTAFQAADGSVVDTTNIKTLRFTIPDGSNRPVMIDQIRLNCPSEVAVLNNADSGSGSLRNALNTVCVDGTITFADTLAGETITLLSGPLTLGKNVTIDAADAPGLTISGNHADRVFIVNAGTTATLKNLTVADGYGWDLAGGILNNGSLTLDHVLLTGNVMATNAGDFWKGGGGIYNGQGSTFNLIDSTVANNQAAWSGGGVYSFFNSTTTILRSTISGNTSGDVGGAIRSLGNMTITNSTISGNTATGWMGGGFFHTDGIMNIVNSTIVNNTAPAGTTGGGFVGTFTSANATLTLSNTIIAGNSGSQCFYAPWGSGIVTATSLGHNLVSDTSCFAVSSDLITGTTQIGPLADNGGPTLTHALLAGSPAIDAGDDITCTATDQRGVNRPQGTHCDIGAYEAP